jgi:hypothetical protein
MIYQIKWINTVTTEGLAHAHNRKNLYFSTVFRNFLASYHFKKFQKQHSSTKLDKGYRSVYELLGLD